MVTDAIAPGDEPLVVFEKTCSIACLLLRIGTTMNMAGEGLQQRQAKLEFEKRTMAALLEDLFQAQVPGRTSPNR